MKRQRNDVSALLNTTDLRSCYHKLSGMNVREAELSMWTTNALSEASVLLANMTSEIEFYQKAIVTEYERRHTNRGKAEGSKVVQG